MEKQKAQMRVEERDKRAEEIKNQMMNVIVEDTPSEDDSLPFEIPGIDETVPETEDVVDEEIPEEIEKSSEEKKEKKKADKQVSLFSF